MSRAFLLIVYSLVFLAITSAEAVGQTVAKFPLPVNPEADRNAYRIRIAPCFWNGVQRPRDNSLLANAEAAAALWDRWIPGVAVSTGRWQELPDTQSGVNWAPAWAEEVAKDCLAAHGGVGARENVLVVLHPALDVKGYSNQGWSVVGTVQSRQGAPGALRDGIGRIAHEIGHGFSLEHSAGWAWDPWGAGPLRGIPSGTLLARGNGARSTNVGTNPNHPWDYGDNGDVMGDNFARLNPYNRERLGLTAIGSVQDHWSRGNNGRYKLCDKRGTTDIARVPLDRGNPNKYLLLEYRLPRDETGLLLKGDGKLSIYIVDERTGYADMWGTQGPARDLATARRSILLRDQNGVFAIRGSPAGDVHYGLTDPLQGAEIDRGGGFTAWVYRVGDVESPEPDVQCVDVEVRGVPSDLTPETCAEGFVWREATPEDKVCVTRSRQREVARANRSGSRLLTCPSGQVHRMAASRPGVDRGDWLCVSPAERALVREENAAAYSRTFRAQASGPWSCKEGFVWRQANTYDRVCVRPEAAEAIARQNSQRPLGCPNRSDPGVSRDAWPGDSRCVTAAEAAEVAAQNADATKNWLWGGV
jgi:hypothetical protein